MRACVIMEQKTDLKYWKFEVWSASENDRKN